MLGEGAEACSGEKPSKVGVFPGPSLWPPSSGLSPVMGLGYSRGPSQWPFRGPCMYLLRSLFVLTLGLMSWELSASVAPLSCRGSRLLNGSLSWATVEGEGCFLTQDGHVEASEVQVPRGQEVLWRLSCVQSPHRTVGRVKAGREETLRSDTEQVSGRLG